MPTQQPAANVTNRKGVAFADSVRRAEDEPCAARVSGLTTPVLVVMMASLAYLAETLQVVGWGWLGFWQGKGIGWGFGLQGCDFALCLVGAGAESVGWVAVDTALEERWGILDAHLYVTPACLPTRLLPCPPHSLTAVPCLDACQSPDPAAAVSRCQTDAAAGAGAAAGRWRLWQQQQQRGVPSLPLDRRRRGWL